MMHTKPERAKKAVGCGGMTGRSVPEWTGRTPDSAIPPRVRVRVFEAHGGICALTGAKIHPGDRWDLDHRIPLALGGAHAESNLQPVLLDAHRRKSAADAKVKAKAARVRKRHIGVNTVRSSLPGSRGSRWKRKVNGQVVLRDEDS